MTPRGNLVFGCSDTMISEVKLWKQNIRFCVFQSRSPRLIFDDCVKFLCQWNGTCNMLLVQPMQKVNLGNTTFISYCVNMFIHGHRKILSYIKLGRHVFSHFSRPQSSRQFLADAASQRSVVPPHKTVEHPHFFFQGLYVCGSGSHASCIDQIVQESFASCLVWKGNRYFYHWFRSLCQWSQSPHDWDILHEMQSARFLNDLLVLKERKKDTIVIYMYLS